MKERFIAAVVGNPNCGKTTLFNALTGAKQRVGNWPGVTVERKTGRYRFEGRDFEIVDLPGTYSLDVADEEVSLDEKIARDYAHSGDADVIVNILDASNLERNLYLTTQLLEMKAPLVVALNMIDVARERGMEIDADALSAQLGCPVVPVVASQGRGIDALRRTLVQAAQTRPMPHATFSYDPRLEQAIESLTRPLAEAAKATGAEPRWLAARLLEGDDLALEIAGDAVSREVMRSPAMR